MPLVVVSSHRKIMKLANNSIRMESEQLSGSLWDQDNFSNASSSAKMSEDQYNMMRNQLTLEQFQQTELAANFNKVFQNKKLPFKYKTFYYLQKILYSKEIEADIIEFRNKESRVRQKWMYSDLMQKDINRTKHLKDNPHLHEDVKRVVEYYCAT